MWIAIGIVGFFILLWFFPVTLWFQALISGVRINLIQLVLMRWRKVPPSTIVMAMVTGTKAGLTLDANSLEAHYLAKGNVTKVVNALISADKANIPLDFKMAAAIDLAGRDVFEAVQMSVNPKVINTPPVSAVAKDGIQLIAKARVTVRAASNNWWEGQVKKPSSPVWVKALSPALDPLHPINRCWKIPITFLR
jgi:uncharacterized protein YqfA (UPF0365 family)